ncbi:MAG: OmpA family protein [Elusimicrobiota bacterium]
MEKTNKKVLQSPLIWLTVYSDWITNMTLFFILLFYVAFTAMDKGLREDEMYKLMKGMVSTLKKQTFKEELNETISKITEIKEVSGITIAEKEMKVTLSETILFDSGNAVLKENGKKILIQVMQNFKGLQYPILIEGHSCNLPLKQKISPKLKKWELAILRSAGSGPYRDNWELSTTRSIKIVEFLTHEKIIEPKRIRVVACGPSEPLFPNDGEENRKKNRRIEIKIIKE